VNRKQFLPITDNEKMEIFPTPQAIHRQPVTGWFGWLSRLTVADGLLGLVLLAAALLRLANLGHLPLSDAEATQALAVWQFWQPGTAVLSPMAAPPTSASPPG
jgi:hypothetical protein